MRKLLVVVDMQNDFIDGSLGTKEAEAIVDNVIKVISTYDPKDIFATRDTHPENYLETQEGRNLPVVHCVKNTPGWELNEKVAAALRDAVSGVLRVVCPQTVDYERLFAAVEYFAGLLTRSITGFERK